MKIPPPIESLREAAQLFLQAEESAKLAATRLEQGHDHPALLAAHAAKRAAEIGTLKLAIRLKTLSNVGWVFLPEDAAP
jgi:hypothetical protein